MSEQILEGQPSFFMKKIGVNDNKGLFGIAKFEHPGEFMPGDSMEQRCDSYKTRGPTGFHKWDSSNNLCSCGSTEMPDPKVGNHSVVLDQLKCLYPVIEASPHGLIIYFEFRDDEIELQASKQHFSTCAHSIQELFRLMLEWEFAASTLGSTEDVAATSANMLQVLDMPENIREWIINEVPPEKVARFLAGETNAQDRTTDPIPDLSQEFYDWVYNKITQCRSFGEYDD
jgi:hypothetical protein